MSLVRLNNITIGFDDRSVLRDEYLRLDEGERIGLIGVNGAGKTTVLRLILGQLEPDAGIVEIEHGVQLGYFSQFSTLDGTQSLVQVLDALFGHVHQLEERLLEVEIALEEGDSPAEMERLVHQQAELLEEMDKIGGWTYQNTIDTALTRLGFAQEHRTCPIDQLSGGWRNRAALAKLLIEKPDVLLLDEPTNFLDVAGLTWLEEWLQAFRGGVIIVSHDRDFLEHTATRMVEIENYHFQLYPGGFGAYVQQKRRRIKSLERQFVHEESLLIYENEAIEEREAMRRDPAKAMRRKLANVKKKVEPRPMDRIVTSIYDRLHVPKMLCRADGLSKAYDEQLLFSELSFEIQRSDRVCVLGPNGCGKSTLLKIITDQVEPDAGQVTWGKAASYADFNAIFAELDPNDTVSHAINTIGLAYLAARKRVHEFLSLMRFAELDLHQRIGTLSGGQKARVALAQCLLSGAGLVILDEPTNHLDLTSTQVMERALVHFPGAVLVVSHDRFFVDKVANRLLVFGDKGSVQEVAGNWTQYTQRQALGETS